MEYVKAYQVPVEAQESRWEDDDVYKELCVINHDTRSISYPTDLYTRIESRLNDVTEEIEWFEDIYCEGKYKSLTELFNYWIPRTDGQSYDEDTAKKMRDLVEYYNEPNRRDSDEEILAELMSYADNYIYKTQTIHGSCQGMCATVIYPVIAEENTTDYKGDRDGFTSDGIDTFETMFYNEGSEWRIDLGDGEEFYHYTVEYNEDKIKAELADVAGCDAAHILLFTEDNDYELSEKDSADYGISQIKDNLETNGVSASKIAQMMSSAAKAYETLKEYSGDTVSYLIENIPEHGTVNDNPLTKNLTVEVPVSDNGASVSFNFDYREKGYGILQKEFQVNYEGKSFITTIEGAVKYESDYKKALENSQTKQ